MDIVTSTLSRERLWATLAVAGVVLWTGYGVALGVYRLYFSPLAKFPGPNLAALTQWYEAYFDLVHRGGGQFVFEIKRMHNKYGPIVRINPFELHIDDPEYYDVIYATGKSYNKLESSASRFDMPLAAFSTADAEKHRMRRAAISPFFSKAKIRSHNGLIQGVINHISRRLSTEYAGTNKVLHIRQMWGCMVSDVITELAFARRKNFADAPNLHAWFTDSLSDMLHLTHWMTHVHWVITIMNSFPKWLVKLTSPQLASVIEYREEIETQVRDILSGKNDEKDKSHPTIFHELLSSSLPPEELTLDRLHHEAMTLVGAGDHATKWALTIGAFNIINNAEIRRKLKEELETAMPDPAKILSWGELEKLHYLSAVVTETLRASFGGVQRMPRINRHSSWHYGGYEIPPGIPVGMDHFHMHTNEILYPESGVFKPSRWLGNPKGPDGVKPLTAYMTAFGKGTRMCSGINLAYAELYIGLATLFRRHEFEFFETDESDVEFYMDLFSSHPKRSSKGVRVLVKK